MPSRPKQHRSGCGAFAEIRDAALPTHPNVMLLTRGSLNTLLSLPIALCLAVYALTWLSRPSVSDALKVDDPWTYGFPSWYGPLAPAPAALQGKRILVIGSEQRG